MGLLGRHRSDPVEMALAADLQQAALEHVAANTRKTYTVAMYMMSVANGAKTFAPVKAASAAIAFYQKINLFSHESTQSPAVCLVREAAIRRFGLNTNNRKEPFEWAQVVKFAKAYGSLQQGYSHLVVTTIAVVMFVGM
jgi:hypothetical protein